MRQLEYAVEGKAANLKTFAVDEPGHGGACHLYCIDWTYDRVDPPSDQRIVIQFQNGPINADGNGVNGVQMEDLIAICIDRLDGFQKGPYKCDDNQAALNMLKVALDALQKRTRDRIARGVEGTHTV